eukprot:gene12992-15282_t
MLQGIPIGLTFGTIPFLLHKYSTYTQIGIFSFAGFPYSLKILWSPFVDSVYSRDFGRRKSWIVPIQMIAGLLFIVVSYYIEVLLEHSVEMIWSITAIFFITIVLMATQDIAVDGWALTILSKSNLHYASTCQTIGLNSGYFLSYTIFLALNSPDFSNNYLRSSSAHNPDEGVVSLPGYLFFWVQSDECEVELEPMQIYKSLWRIINKPHIRMLALLFLTSKIVFQSNESALSLRLIEKGMKKADLASFSLIQFPCVIFFSIVTAKMIKDKPLTLWTNAYISGVFCVGLNMLMLINFQVKWSYFLILILFSLASSFMHTAMSVSQGAFFLRISDKNIGGTYLTLLNTIANLGGTWPKFPVLYLIDKLSLSHCVVPGKPTTSSMEFVGMSEAIVQTCKDEGGELVMMRDGYLIVTTLLIIYGVFMWRVLKKYFVPIERIKR